MKIAIGAGFFTKGDMNVNSGHLAKIMKLNFLFDLLYFPFVFAFPFTNQQVTNIQQ